MSKRNVGFHKFEDEADDDKLFQEEGFGLEKEIHYGGVNLSSDSDSKNLADLESGNKVQDYRDHPGRPIMSTNIFSGAEQFKPEVEAIDIVSVSLTIALSIIWVIQFIIGVICIWMYTSQQKYNPYVYVYTIVFTFKWLFAGVLASLFSVISWILIRIFCVKVNCPNFKSGWTSLFIVITGVLLLISVPTGLHALHISRSLPLIFTIFIYLEVFMSALHVLQVLVDRILHVYSNDKDLILQMLELPSKPYKQALKEKLKKDDPYSRAHTGFKYENTRASLRKKKATEQILKEFTMGKNKKQKSASNELWKMLKSRSKDDRIKQQPKRKEKLVDVFSQNVLAKFNKKGELKKVQSSMS